MMLVHEVGGRRAETNGDPKLSRTAEKTTIWCGGCRLPGMIAEMGWSRWPSKANTASCDKSDAARRFKFHLLIGFSASKRVRFNAGQANAWLRGSDRHAPTLRPARVKPKCHGPGSLNFIDVKDCGRLSGFLESASGTSRCVPLEEVSRSPGQLAFSVNAAACSGRSSSPFVALRAPQSARPRTAC